MLACPPPTVSPHALTLHTAHVLTSRYYLLDSKSGIIGAEFLDSRRAPSTAPVCF
jgi:hypothetical protein